MIPNPVSGSAIVQFIDILQLENAQFIIYDLSRNILQTYILAHAQTEIKIEPDVLASGMYIGILRTQDGAYYSQEIIVIK